ncbi:unnamed protein product, partial [Durusdinium trenchii]
MTKLRRLMGQLLVRHEDALNSVSMQDSYVIFFQTKNSGDIPLLIRSASQWRDLPDDQAQTPLRCYLIQAIVSELIARFQKLKLQLEDEQTKTAAIKSQTILEDLSFPYLVRHSQQQRLVIGQSQSISWATMESHLGLLQQAFQEPANCVRFFAMASAQSKGEVVPWKLQISLRNDSLSSLMRQLAQWIEKIHILQCGNEGNWCYANAGLVTLIWTLLHATSFDEYTFGTAWEAVRSVELASHPSLAGLFEGQTSSDQRDIAEFTSEVLAWCKSSRASQAWERRFVTPDGTCCLEKGGMDTSSWTTPSFTLTQVAREQLGSDATP